MNPSQRIARSTDNAFAQLTELKRDLRRRGREFIDLSEGTPDFPPSESLRRAFGRFCQQDHNHGYPTRRGISLLRERIFGHLEAEYGIDSSRLDCLPAAGSKELIGHITQAIVDPGDVVLLPELHYPAYRTAAHYAGAEIQLVPMDSSHVPVLANVADQVIRRARLAWVNSPNNPTATAISRDALQSIVAFCRTNEIVVASDLAYSHVRFDGESTPSALARTDPGGVLELHSLSKSLHVPGWRAAFLAGDPDLVRLVEASKSVFDTGIFVALQKAMCYGLHHFRELAAEVQSVYRSRAMRVTDELTRLGIAHTPPQGAFFVWCRIPTGDPAEEFSARLLDQASLLVMPGTAFGRAGEGHFRLSLTQPDDVLDEAMARLSMTVEN